MKVNFKKRKISLKYFTGLPDYSRALIERLHSRTRENGGLFKDFYAVELCNLEYLPERGAAIVPHLDDCWLWGERLVLLNFVSATKMTFTLPETGPDVDEERERYQAYSATHAPRAQVQLDIPSLILRTKLS